MSTTVAPKEYSALIGRVFRDIGPNGMNRVFRVADVVYFPDHRLGPWLAQCYPHGWKAPFSGPRYRKVDRFLDPSEYEEIT